VTDYTTVFGSMTDYEKGRVIVIDDDPKAYVFSNVFEVANTSKPYEKVAVGKNLEYVLEAIRCEGTSEWRATPHDEFALVMDGCIEIELVKLDAPRTVAPPHVEGSVRLDAPPQGRRMGRMRLSRGHQALLPQGAAYRFRSANVGVIVLQTLLGAHSVQKWSEICYT
jgi:hypothetical protein